MHVNYRHYVKEYGEGVDRMCRELEANGTIALSFRTDDFILKVTVPRVTEKVTEKSTRVTEKEEKLPEKLTEKHFGLIEKLIEKALKDGDRLTENKLSILKLMMDDPYISRSDLSKYVGISENSISRNIEAMRGKYLRRVGPDKGGFWEVICD